MTRSADLQKAGLDGRSQREAAAPRYRLEYAGQLLEVEPSDVGLGHQAQLFVDGHLYGEHKAKYGEQKAKAQRGALHADDVTLRIMWGDYGGVKTWVLVGNDAAGHTLTLPFAPPPGSRTARLEQFERDHSVLYAARHLVKPLLQVLASVLGLGVVFTALLPRFNWTWVPPFIRDKFLGDGPDWLEPLLGSPAFQFGKWLVPVALALFVALDEYEKHKQRAAQGEDARGPHR